MQKSIPHRDCSETGAISKCVSNIAFLFEINREKTLLFALNFDLKNKRTRYIFNKRHSGLNSHLSIKDFTLTSFQKGSYLNINSSIIE